MNKLLLIAALVSAGAAQAGTIVDTGTPSGVGGYLLDSNDSYAGQITLGASLDITDIAAHVLGGNAGETFTISVYTNAANNLPSSNALYGASVTFGSDGWNGVSGKSWHLDAGTYWVAVEVGNADTLNGFATLDYAAPNPLAVTAFNAGSGYRSSPLSFGLQISAVPEPATYLLMLGGLAALGLGSRRRG